MSHINKEMNCEDIAMCVLVSQFLRDVSWSQSSVISVKPKVTLRNLEAMTGEERERESESERERERESESEREREREREK